MPNFNFAKVQSIVFILSKPHRHVRAFLSLVWEPASPNRGCLDLILCHRCGMIPTKDHTCTSIWIVRQTTVKKRESKGEFVGWLASTRFNHATGSRSATFVLISLALVSFSACRMGPHRASTVSSLPALKYELHYSVGSPRSPFAPIETSALRAEASLPITPTL